MKNKHIGSDFDDFLRDENLLEVAEAAALIFLAKVDSLDLSIAKRREPDGPETISGPPKP